MSADPRGTHVTQTRAGWLFVSPALGLIGVFFVVPVVVGLLLSFTDFDIYALGDPGVARTVGVRNYAQIVSDRESWGALRNMLIFVAGLQNIPEEQYEAARIDGAGGWARFRHITVPGLGPTFLLVGVLTMIGQFQLFAEPYVMTAGGPLRSTVSLILLMYEQ